jgi:cytoskeletal protein CcmA (bactofilin family)
MFKRPTEESEWSRFSQALGGKDEKAENDGEPRDEEETGTLSDIAAASPNTRPPLGDTNLTFSAPTPSTTTRPAFSIDDVESTVGEHTSFDGTYRSENSIRILGSAEGEIECKKAVFIEENAKVSARVTAASITVAGEVNGELTCSGRVEIRPSGRVTGTINAASLIMQEGAFFDGNLKMKQSSEAAASSS